MNQRQWPPEASTLPRPENKRLWAQLADGMTEAISAMFDEAHRRDPKHERTWVVLLDGAHAQREAVSQEAQRRGVRIRCSFARYGLAACAALSVGRGDGT